MEQLKNRITEFLALTVASSAVILIGCAHPSTKLDLSPSNSVTRDEAIRIAEAYRSHSWRPSARNAFSGQDSNGIHVQTPDIGYQPASTDSRAGWWVPNHPNIGIPYQWGGFDTPEEFDQKLARGFFAGDIYTFAKRKHLDNAVSITACGIDCSGFISRCWRLDRAYSTRELATLCDPLADFSSLQKGDLINKENVHALLFVRFLNAEKSRFLAYETGSPPTWKVVAHPIDVDYVRNLGYLPYRYRMIRD
ncbi:MAG: hypothetical protein ACI9R3_001041 [Verrucomicrobiales bacterium]|jgi:hypothetical protein